ncbi:AraC family transcriptional regulator [Staphylococcus lutrae]|nr:AraC family transcriptional regulator [Staphylococcus lutrae]
MREVWKHFDISHDNIVISECGIQQFLPEQTYSYAVSETFVLHYVEIGKGIIKINNKTYYSKDFNGFILKRGQRVTYKGDKNIPWKTFWVGLRGSNLQNFLKTNQLNNQDILKFEDHSHAVNMIKDICYTTKENTRQSDYWYKYKTYELLYCLEKEFKQTDLITLNNNQDIIHHIYEYICNNYTQSLKIDDIAHRFAISKSHLFTQFKRNYGRTPKQFILKLRIDKATQILRETDYPINVVGQMVGFNDYFVFEKAFKKIVNRSPKNYRLEKSMTKRT